ncbi:unnamed protein product [Mesocestoides corti]|uniref:Uncharacterized protein n=1 Tax=Mesocestoides corti TaxID=53468 RepID=A0A0R3UPJ4_MESCO|nr:unnamed protein product [Mesocestoides corti]
MSQTANIHRHSPTEGQSHWLFPEVTSRPKLIDEPGMRQSVKMASPEPSADTESLSNPEVTIYTPPSTRARSQGESLSVLTRAGCRSPDWLWFAVVDESPGSSDVYVFDPGSESARTSWLRELTDIQQMQAEIQLALQNPRRFHYVSRVGRQAKTHSSSDVTFLFAGDRGCRNCFLSAHSSSTRLPVDASSTGSEDGPIHFRNISAPHTHENKLPSENRSLEGWSEVTDCLKRLILFSQLHKHQAESDSSSQKGLILHFSANISNESSVPDIVQTPDDVFLAPFPPTSQSDEGNQDNNHLKLPVDTTRRSYTRRRSLSQGDADTSEERLAERSQLPRQHAIQVGTSSLSSSSGPSSVCEASTAPVDTCDAKSPSEDTGGAPGSHDVSPTDNPTRIRRRLFRWSIVDKSTLIETSKSPPGLLVATCTPQTSDRCTGRQRLGSVTPQLFRKPSLLFGSRKTSEPPKAPSMRMISRFRLSFRVGSHQTGLPAATSTDAV